MKKKEVETDAMKTGFLHANEIERDRREIGEPKH